MRAQFLFLLLLLTADLSQAAAYEVMPLNLAPYAKYPAQTAELQQIRDRLKLGDNREPDLKRQLQIVEELGVSEPDWIDIRWKIAEKAFELGSFYTKESDLPYARTVFVRGQKAAEKCLKQQKDHVICKLLLGAMLGKLGSIDGVFASLKQAKLVEQLWLDVTQSKFNHAFAENNSVQGGARYALGIFYRLVPDYALLKWLFDVKGDLEKSISYHREAIALDGPNTCSKVMLAVALICSAKGEAQAPRAQEGLKHLAEARLLQSNNAVNKACWDDIPRLSQDLSKSCGYESSRQQETKQK